MTPTRAKHIALSNFMAGVPKDPLQFEYNIPVGFYREYQEQDGYPICVEIRERGDIKNLSGDIVRKRSGFDTFAAEVPFVGY